jgi:YHS domain-containing protein
MKRHNHTIAIAALAGLFSSCATTNPQTVSGAAKPYMAKTCIVSGNKLGSMGSPVSEVYKGQEVKFCCKPCVKKFHATPEKYIESMKH